MKSLSILPMPHSFLKYDNVSPILAIKPISDFDTKYESNCDNEENIDENYEFSFACIKHEGPFVFADEIFDNGQIRPTYHAFDQSLIFTITHDKETSPLQSPLRKLFVEQVNSFSSNSKVCSNDTLQNMTMVEVDVSNHQCKKSNSTGFSTKWRFKKNLKLRSNSDGKDAFVFLNPSLTMSMRSKEAKKKNVVLKNKKGEKVKTALSPHEKFYVSNRKRKESIRRKSFLPYRQGLIGFFTNVNRFRRNPNPF
ncbi:uncharacterized protein LOC113859600 [Abrus precatorius]|uniref:Uncharacterized protein LOC113859600 n=1 Tax=Abrus precatorius TaxID=3816 RepID=A0A8B8KW81_ABRPR|nr:uncharacterized protein LOC113859600 [Abrus precatorius]